MVSIVLCFGGLKLGPNVKMKSVIIHLSVLSILIIWVFLNLDL